MELPAGIYDERCDERSLRRSIIRMFMENEYLPEVEGRLAGLISGHPELGNVLRQIYREILFPSLPYTRGLLLAPNEVHAQGVLKPCWRLEITHNCTIPACADTLCRLCEKSPRRRCGVNCLKEKYAANKGLVTKCDQTIIILLKNNSTGEVANVDGDVMISLVNDQKCSAYFQERTPLCSDDVSGLLVDQDRASLINTSLSSRNNRTREGLIIPMKSGHAYVPRDVTTETTTMKAYKSKGIKYQLLIRVVPGTGNIPAPEDTIACISNSFTTLTSKGILGQKSRRPLVTDGIKTVEKIGRKTIRKFNNLKDFVQGDGLPHSIMTVGELRKFFKLMNQNSFLASEVQKALRISGGDWEIMHKVANQAIEHDNFVRSWGPFQDQNGTYQLLYDCESGELSLDSGPIAIIKNESVVPREAWDNTLATLITTLDTMAKNCWWKNSHPGWRILPCNTNNYEEELATKTLFTASDSSSMTPNHDYQKTEVSTPTDLSNSFAPVPSKVLCAPPCNYRALPSSMDPLPAENQRDQGPSSCLSSNLLEPTSESEIFLSRYTRTPLLSANPYVAGHTELEESNTDAGQSSPAMHVDHNVLHENQRLCCVTTSAQNSGYKRKCAEIDESKDSDYPSKAPALQKSDWPTSSLNPLSSLEISHPERGDWSSNEFYGSFDDLYYH